MTQQYSTLRLILGDQLNAGHSWYKDENCKNNTLYLIAELHQEQEYVSHHIQKTQAFFAAMEQFAHALRNAGHDVLYLTLDDTKDKTLCDVIASVLVKYEIKHFEYQQPDEYRLHQQLSEFPNALTASKNSSDPSLQDIPQQLNNIQKSCVSTEHFFIEHHELIKYFKENTAHRMESFYRKLRKKHSILLQNGEPEGGKWNYDSSNRNKIKPDDIKNVPAPLLFENDLTDITKRIKRHNIKTIGYSLEHLVWPVNRAQAKELLHFFVKHCLVHFGQFQDAMTNATETNKQSLWSLYHSRVSFALNTKMISPHYVINQAITAYRENEKITIEQIEGFVRQILGWREFVRGIYWLNMPGYQSKNELKASVSLPNYFWTGKTKMACMSHSITQSLEFAYAHHIQRLMITGNFLLMAGVDPDEVDEWYLGIYIDAIEWVEMPNTRGMSQFADGGLLASKAYAASGNYINKMSDYCKSCFYDVKQKTGNKACPYNSLYWGFMNKHADKFGNNPRQAMVYKNWNKKSDEEKQLLLERYDWIVNNLSEL